MKKFTVVILLLGIFALGFFVWWKNGTAAANSKDKTPTIFIVRKDEGVRQIANNLKQQGLIKDPIVFFLLVRQLGFDKKIQAGDFRLNPSMTATDVANNLTHGTLDIWITIPEGQRADEIADTLKKSIPSYKESWRDQLSINEGYLFPDTYLIPRDADINLILTLFKNNFDTKFESVKNQKSTNLTDRETVIVASLVEREARHASDRPLVASVITNRLGIGMKLDIDATIQYALGYQKDQKSWWKKGLTFDDLDITSKYNTYRNPGLPPSPISNPGLSAISAALTPANTNYLYYITDKNGANHYAETLEGQNANIKKYGL